MKFGAFLQCCVLLQGNWEKKTDHSRERHLMRWTNLRGGSPPSGIAKDQRVKSDLDKILKTVIRIFYFVDNSGQLRFLKAGQRLTELCQKNALVIANTLFQQHRR